MTKYDSLEIAYARWEGAAQAFSNAIRSAHGMLITKHTGDNHQEGLSNYDLRGYAADSSDHLERIDRAIEFLKKSRKLFIEAELLREKIKVTTE